MKHLLRIPSDRRLVLRLKHDKKTAKSCGFLSQTPSHGLFTHFRHRLGEQTYHEIFDRLATNQTGSLGLTRKPKEKRDARYILRYMENYRPGKRKRPQRHIDTIDS